MTAPAPTTASLRRLHPGGILGLVGRTPAVRLDDLSRRSGCEVVAKLERFNPGGSIKDRTALNMLRELVARGELVPGRSVVVESSSGNLAIGMAQVCRYFGLDLVCVVDPRTTKQNMALLEAYQASVEMVTEPDPDTGEYLPMRLRRVRELVATIPDAYWPNQYANPLNPEAHEQTMAELVEEFNREIDVVFCAVSTFGTLRGCAQYIRRHGLSTRVVAVDAEGSALFHDSAAPRLLPGHGASTRPALFDRTLADDVVHVSDLDTVVACRRLVRDEAVLAGGSSGAVASALEKRIDSLGRAVRCVLIFPDGGDRYLDTIYSDAWVEHHLGAVSHMWR